MWLASGLLGLFFGRPATVALLAGLGFPGSWASAAQLGSSLLDVVIAVGVAVDSRARWSTAAQLAVVLGYTLVIGAVLPGLWLDPFGPLIKNVPILLAILIHGAIGDRR